MKSSLNFPTLAAMTWLLCCPLPAVDVRAEDQSSQTGAVTSSPESIAKGRAIFLRRCSICHGADGKAQINVVSSAADLTEPNLWKQGSKPEEMARTIGSGLGMGMPAFKAQLKEAEISDVVNYIRSLWVQTAPTAEPQAPNK